jgi:hypothetical protein
LAESQYLVGLGFGASNPETDSMLQSLALGLFIVCLTVLVHVFGLIWTTRAMNWMVKRFRLHGGSLLAMVTVVIGLFIILLVQTSVWAICYEFVDAFPNFSTSMYFSVASFATLGLGDVIPAHGWRLLGAIESLNGFLMIGWSTAYLVSASIRLGPFRSGEHF